jgi:hypothetical protein
MEELKFNQQLLKFYRINQLNSNSSPKLMRLRGEL